MMATPLVIAPHPAADPTCQWSTQLNVDDQGGSLNVISYLYVGGANSPNTVPVTPVFGTTRIDAWGGLQGVLCFSGITPGGVSNIEVLYANGYAEQVTLAFKMILKSPKVKAIFVNIFGGIMKCDIVATGVVAAAKELGLKVPLVVRLEGTNVELGRKILSESGLKIEAATTMADGAKKVVAAVGEAR